jgi:hypothetical protein
MTRTLQRRLNMMAMVPAKTSKHYPVEIHYARKYETRSTLMCFCGHLIEVEGSIPIASQEALERAWNSHVRQMR